MVSRKLYTLLVSFSLLTGCTHPEMYEGPMVKEAQVTDHTRATNILASIPAPSDKISVALYDFQDQTGQFKNNDKYTDYSSAVTKGGHSILTKALLDAGNKQWFTVIERNGLKDLLQEREIIRNMRNNYRQAGEQSQPLPPLLFGGMLIEGGITAYDSNIITGGAGAIYLGIGGNAQYHRDMVTVSLRAVSVQTGEVVLSVTSSKTLFSIAMDTNVLKYITFDRLFQAEAGFTSNEPTQLAVRQAIETAVYSLIMEGAIDKVWDFKSPVAGQQAVAEYIQRRDGIPPVPVTGQAPVMKQAMNEQPVQQMAQAAPVEPVVAVTPAPAQAPQATSVAEVFVPNAQPVQAPVQQAAVVQQQPAAAPVAPQQQPVQQAAVVQSQPQAQPVAQQQYAQQNAQAAQMSQLQPAAGTQVNASKATEKPLPAIAHVTPEMQKQAQLENNAQAARRKLPQNPSDNEPYDPKNNAGLQEALNAASYYR